MPAGSLASLPNRSAMDGMGIALSGMQSAQTRVAVSAHNVANLLTEGFHPQRAVQTSLASGGSRATVATAAAPEPVDLEREIVGQIVAKTQYAASARVLGVELDLKGSLLDVLA
jgi:flagellar hook protein FlgE